MSVNVDPKEIEKFAALASRWWDPQGEFKPLHDLNPLRVGYINERAPLAGKRVLDVGCGGGILSEAMAALGADVTGIDLGEEQLKVAKLHALEVGIAAEQQVSYECIAVEALAAREPASFDIVTCLEMLEHVPDPAAVVKSVAQLVKADGDVFFSTLNRNPKSYAFAILGAEYILGMLPKGTHDYARFIKPSELAAWSRDAHLDVSSLTGMHFNPLTNHYSLGSNVDVNYIMHCQPQKRA